VLADFNKNKSETLYFSAKFFKENSVYYFKINYENFLGTQSSSDLILKFGTAKTATVFINLLGNQVYFAHKEIKIPIKISS